MLVDVFDTSRPTAARGVAVASRRQPQPIRMRRTRAGRSSTRLLLGSSQRLTDGSDGRGGPIAVTPPTRWGARVNHATERARAAFLGAVAVSGVPVVVLRNDGEDVWEEEVLAVGELHVGDDHVLALVQLADRRAPSVCADGHGLGSGEPKDLIGGQQDGLLRREQFELWGADLDGIVAVDGDGHVHHVLAVPGDRQGELLGSGLWERILDAAPRAPEEQREGCALLDGARTADLLDHLVRQGQAWIAVAREGIRGDRERVDLRPGLAQPCVLRRRNYRATGVVVPVGGGGGRRCAQRERQGGQNGTT